MIITVTRSWVSFSKYYYIMHNQINDLIIVNLLIFSHTFWKEIEHFCGINRMSPTAHCKLKHCFAELKWTEKDLKVFMNSKYVFELTLCKNCINIYYYDTLYLILWLHVPPWISYRL